MTLKTDLKEFPASLREKLYNDVCDCLEGITDGKTQAIQYFDLFNNQFSHLAEETVMRYPCVLVEFPAIQWRSLGRGVQQASVQITLHVAAKITNGKTFRLFGRKRETDGLAYMRLLDAIHNRLRTLRLPYAGSFVRTSSVTDHDHDALVVSAETYSVLCNDISGVFPAAKVARKAFDVKISK